MFPSMIFKARFNREGFIAYEASIAWSILDLVMELSKMDTAKALTL